MQIDGINAVTPSVVLGQLRLTGLWVQDLPLTPCEDLVLSGVMGNVLEVKMGLKPGACKRCGSRFLCSPDGEKQITILYDHEAGVLRGIYDRSSRQQLDNYTLLTPSGEFQYELTFALATDEPLELLVFLTAQWWCLQINCFA